MLQHFQHNPDASEEKPPDSTRLQAEAARSLDGKILQIRGLALDSYDVRLIAITHSGLVRLGRLDTMNPLHQADEPDLAGRWVAVDPQGGSGLRRLPTGGVIVDYDSEIDLLCQRVAESGLKRLTIFRYQGSTGFGDVRGRA